MVVTESDSDGFKPFPTKRYMIKYKELATGGPVGYESVYLSTEGYPITEKMLDAFSKLDGRFLPIENRMVRHRNGDAFADAIKNGERIGIASGFKPSGAYHFGHQLTASAVAYFQRNNVQAFMPIADIEAYLSKIEKERYSYWMADNLLDWGASGVNLDATHAYLQSEEDRVSKLAYIVAREVQLELPVDIYGFDEMKNNFPFFFAGMTQVGDILLPQLPTFGNSHSFMVSGQDQDGHMKMTVSLAESSIKNGNNAGYFRTVPSAFYIPHMRGFDVEAIQGDMEQASRTHIINDFKHDKLNILIATDVVARGIDVPTVERVINYDVPNEPLVYFHRIGRTARALEKGSSITFVTEKYQDAFSAILRETKVKIERLPTQAVQEFPVVRGSHMMERPRFSRRRFGGGSHRRSGFRRDSRNSRRFGRRHG